MIKERIVKQVEKALDNKYEVEVFQAENEKFGHYSSNLAMKVAKTRKENPLKIAEEIKEKIVKNDNGLLERIEIVAPGFLNFWVKEEALQDELRNILKEKESYGRVLPKKNSEYINFEFISANPTGLLTMGNARSAFFGDALTRILKFNGFRVSTEYFVNDAKASTQIKKFGEMMLGDGETYKTEFTESIRKKFNKKLEVIKKKFPKEKAYAEAGFLTAQEINKGNKNIIEKKVGIKFDKWFSEESLYRSSATEKVLNKLKEKNLTYEKDGALWLKTSEYGDNEDRVLIRNTGEPTYFLPDLAYQLNKLETRNFDRALMIFGADHHGYVPRLLAGLKALGMEESRLDVFITQLVRLVRNGEEVKMSKRAGQYVTLEELVDEVGLDSARFFFLMHSLDTHMDFDLGLAKERSMKNPVYYLQYAFVRAQGVLRKAPKINFFVKLKLGLLNTKEDIALIRKLIEFSEAVNDSAQKENPQILARYALELAREFNNFYEKEKVVIVDKNITRARLALVLAVKIILGNCLNLLGLSQPKKM